MTDILTPSFITANFLHFRRRFLKSASLGIFHASAANHQVAPSPSRALKQGKRYELGAVPSSAVFLVLRLLTSSIVTDENEFPSFGIVMFISRTRTEYLAPLMYLSGIANMFSLILCLVVFSWLNVPCIALPGTLAPQTFGVEYGPPIAASTPRPTTFVENVHKRGLWLSIGKVPETSSPPPPTSSMNPSDHNLSPSKIAGMVVGSLWLIGGFIVCLLAYRRLNRRRLRRQRAIPKPKVAISHMPVTLPIASPVGSFFALSSDWDLSPSQHNTMEYKFMVLLALFGSKGVPLRELIMLASLKLATKTSDNHWLVDGERGPLVHAIDAETTYAECSFLEAFARETSTTRSVEMLERRLVSRRLINTEYQDLSGTLLSAQQCWFIDGRIWRINSTHPMTINAESQLEVFLEVFADIPCKDISPLAERQREIYYYHAHQAMGHLHKVRSLSVKHLQNIEHIVLVFLQVLSHRFQTDDNVLLRFAERHLPRSGLHPDWNILLLVAQSKATISINDRHLSQIRNKIFQAVEMRDTRGDTSPRAKGFIGWLFVELLDAAEAADCTEVIGDTLRKWKHWMLRTSNSDMSALERIMLCRAFARFGTSDDSVMQPREYDLLFGYHLSRAGVLEKAEELLLSGLEYYASSPMSKRVWSYRFELVSLIMRAGRWSEAEAWLASAWEAVVSRSSFTQEPDSWKRSGECGEIFILLGLYQADCDMAMGKLKSAENRLKETMERTLFMQDYYMRALRSTLITRLMKVQMWQQFWGRATVTAQALIEDTIASGNCLSTTGSSESIVLTVLALVNKLVWIGDVLGADRLLMSVKGFEDTDYCVLQPDIKLYLKQRRAAVSLLLCPTETIQHLEDSRADAEGAITSAPVVDQLDQDSHAKLSGARRLTLINSNTRATEAIPCHSGPNPPKRSSAYRWSSELDHARFVTPGVVRFDDLEVRSHEARLSDTGGTVNAQTAHLEGIKGRLLRIGTRKGAARRGNPVAEKLARAPRPPTHEPCKLKSPTNLPHPN